MSDVVISTGDFFPRRETGEVCSHAPTAADHTVGWFSLKCPQYSAQQGILQLYLNELRLGHRQRARGIINLMPAYNFSVSLN